MYSSLPMFHRIGAAALKPGLQNTIALCEALGNPHKKFKSIHIAGTNGKGSTSHMMASILQSAGYKTGLYTSPHLKNFTERIKINGKEVDEDFVKDFVIQNIPIFENIKPSFFEMTVAMAFKYFELQKVDIAVIEVGLGGRLDSTNVISPEACMITNISMDHQAILGNTLLEIASEKAGIIKQETPVVISEYQEEIASYFETVAKEKNATIVFAEHQYKVVMKGLKDAKQMVDIFKNEELIYPDLVCDLTGNYQQKNIQGVLGFSDILFQLGWKIDSYAVKNGIGKVIENTNFQGRWQILSTQPQVIADVAHNEAGISQLVAQINSMNYQSLYWVFGVVKDKDVNKLLSLLPKEAYYYFCQANIPRAMEVSELFLLAKQHQLKGEIISNVAEALRFAKQNAQKDDLILVGGSTFVVAEVI